MGSNDVASELADKNFWVRYQAASQLCTADATPYAKTLAALLKSDESRLVRHEAAKALCSLGANAVPHAGSLVHALRDSEMLVRRDAAKAISGLGSGAAPYVKQLAANLNDEFWPVRWWVAKALGSIGRPEKPGDLSLYMGPLATAAVSDDEMAVREAAAKTLGAIGDEAVPHIESICEKLTKGDEQEQRNACEALASALGEPTNQGQNAVIKGLQSLVKLARENLAARGVAEDGSKQEQLAVAALEASLSDEDWLTRRRAIDGLRSHALGRK
eukprot:gnl/TRDRNA2_/TRDRNA2_140530_c0_seq1.p1 gnl/TRDRNA2_/TRDRNA2_140530_c0~~gnl/TRDRNA2_/TRDRNA2_140530_c0_seq1.p1  ORF type:complete len:273 (+),score=67.82 gnl/TRDRNA2_/TRDRNA2_140530_c0_seq1:109-927(+)